MEPLDYRARAVLARIRQMLDQFSMKLEVDWDYDVREVLEKILTLAVGELQFGDGAPIDRALLITRAGDGELLEAGAGWSSGEEDLTFSRTIVEETITSGKSLLCEDAIDDPRFRSSDSLRGLQVLTLLSVPLHMDGTTTGALYVERRDARHLFGDRDRAFIESLAETIAPTVHTALQHQKNVRELRQLRSRNEAESRMGHIIGQSTAMQRTLELATTAANLDRTVLITGESGVGKELLAQAIHTQSPRANHPFVIVDCSGLSESLLESELFGHIKGSFTGATADKVGAFESAEGGTVFLDEISDASMPMQQALRRVLQEGEIRRVGDRDWRPVNVRVVCATNRDLAREVEAERFLVDLYHRIHEFPLRLPSLRERREDIPRLAEHFVAIFGERKNPPVRGIDTETLTLLSGRDWQANNVRELRNVIQLCVDLTPSEIITTEVLQRVLNIRGEEANETAPPQEEVRFSPGSLIQLDRSGIADLIRSVHDETPKEKRPWAQLQREFGGSVITETLRQTRWKLRPAARLLGLSPVKLRQEFRQWLEYLLAHFGGREEEVADRLDMPTEILQRKLADLGIRQESSEANSSEEKQ